MVHTMAEISLQKISHSYQRLPNGRADYALRNVDLTCRKGGAYALLGPSGCGKTTILNIVSVQKSRQHISSISQIQSCQY